MDANKNLTQRHEDTKVTANAREWIRLRKAYGATGSEQQTNPPSPSLRRDKPQMDADLRRWGRET